MPDLLSIDASRAAPAAAPVGVPGQVRTVVHGRKPPQGEPVIDRGLRLLAAFGPGYETLSLEQLSIRASLPKATALRLARRLTAWGALERTADGRFVIGLRLLEVAALSPRGYGLRAAALPFMTELHHSTRQHVSLAVRAEREAVLVERLSALHAGRAMFRVGGRLPLHATSVGLVLLAHAPDDVRELVLAGDLSLPGSARTMASSELRRILASVRREGVAVARLDHPEPMTSVAAPVYGTRGHVVAALSVVAPSSSLRPVALKPAVIACAQAISRAVQRRP